MRQTLRVATSTKSAPPGSPVDGRVGERDPDNPHGLPGYTPGKRVILFIATILVVTLGVNIWASLRNRNTANQKALAEKVVDDPRRVKHEWVVSDAGLIETGTAIDNDPKTPELIRRHFAVLLEQRKFFGNFGTAQFKNKPLPGRDGLEKLVPQMVITKADIDGGATLTFATTDAQALSELKQWSAALTEERAKRATTTP
jgi:hypothetical protein